MTTMKTKIGRAMCVAVAMTMGIAITSCKSDKKFNDTVEVLSSLPMFVTNDRVQDTVFVENDKVVIRIDDEGWGELPDWATELAGYDWAPSYFTKKMFGSSIAAYTIGSLLEVKNDDPIKVFFQQMDERNLSFEMRIHGHNYPFSTTEALSFLNADDFDPAVFLAPRAAKYVDGMNEIIDDPEHGLAKSKMGFYLVNMTNEEGNIIVNCNVYQMDTKAIFNAMKADLFAGSSIIPLYCSEHHCKLGFRFKTVPADDLKTNTQFDGVQPMMVPDSEIEKKAEEVRQKAQEAAAAAKTE